MPTWKSFDQQPITHSTAHHLVAIAELLGEYGYARVSDVARRLSITRGSASITLKNLKNRGLVTEDDRRFLGLSDEGAEIAATIRAKKLVMKRLFTELLGVDATQADIDTCKIEHLVSDETAERTTRILRLLESGTAEAEAFIDALSRRDKPSGDDVMSYAQEVAAREDEAGTDRRSGEKAKQDVT